MFGPRLDSNREPTRDRAPCRGGPRPFWLLFGGELLSLLAGCSSGSDVNANGGSSGTRAATGGASFDNSGGHISSGAAGATTGVGGSLPGGGAAGTTASGAGGAGTLPAGGGAGASASSGGAGPTASGGTASGGTASGGAASGGSANGGTGASFPTRITDHLDIGAHDPSMIHAGSKYYLFVTGGLLAIRSSSDVFHYSNDGAVFKTMPAWIASHLGQSIDGLWAPDISFFSGKYHVYYAGSVFGSNHSVIGLATNVTLDSSDPAYKWTDEGLVLESNPTGGEKDDWNAIDPSVAFDAGSAPWLVFGSFWSGIKLRQLDASTGKPSTSDTTLHALASYSNGIEAPSIVSHGGYFYLFVSYDKCCNGVNSTYRTMVGRASSITGPYSDDKGQAMLSGNAVQLLASAGRYIGPGGGTAFRDGDLYYYVHHYYDGQANGKPELSLRPMRFTADWPVLDDPLWQ